MKTVIALTILAALLGAYAFSTSTSSESENEFIDFITTYRKSYFSQQEYHQRFQIFQDNLAAIEELKKNPEDRAQYGINSFADWTDAEFSQLLGFNAEGIQTKKAVASTTTNQVRSDVDHRNSGTVSKVRDQGSCGACWAFAATAALESAVLVNDSSSTLTLSNQELVDCAFIKYGNLGCTGGWHQNAFKYSSKKGGINSEEQYAYKGKRGSCSRIDNQKYAEVESYE